MDNPQKITSFIIRFFHEDSAEGGKLCRGVINHVQDEEELRFTHWGDAVDFIRRFVPLDAEADAGVSNSQFNSEGENSCV